MTPDERVEVRGALISAAQTLLTAGSRYPEITVQQLCDAAGVTRWRFYKHFRDKHELLHSWFEELSASFEATHDVWLQIDHRPSEPELQDAVAELFLPYVPHGALHAAMYDSAVVDPTIRAEVDAVESARVQRLSEHIARGQRGGWIDPTLLPQETSEWIIATGSRGYQRMVTRDGTRTPREFIASFARYAWHVLYALDGE